jgi:hypothetical protein
MIKFEFILDDNEAETLMYAMQRCIAHDNELILDMMASEHPDDYKEASIKCIREHIEYTKSIMEKMNNHKLDSSSWNRLGNIETHTDVLVKVVDMISYGDIICYKCEPLDATYSKRELYSYRKLLPAELKEFKEWLSPNQK